MTIYYNGSRIHRSLDKDSPFHRAIERLGVITSKPVLGGLHHQYCSLVQQPGARTYAQWRGTVGHGIKVTEIAPGMVDTGIRASSDHPRALEALKVRKFEALTSGRGGGRRVCCPGSTQLLS
jgi:hypothetical protein